MKEIKIYIKYPHLHKDYENIIIDAMEKVGYEAIASGFNFQTQERDIAFLLKSATD